MPGKHSLYLCYFGMREPLVQTQVLPYLRELGKLDDLKISLITFEPNLKSSWTEAQIENTAALLDEQQISWKPLPYHKTPSVPATLFDIIQGTRAAMWLIKDENVDVIHARVHVPALMGAIAKKLSGKRTKLLFDIRGFFPEEYTDAGHWKEDGLLYKTVKRIEKWLLKSSDGFIVLTEKARDILFPESEETGYEKHGRPVEVIPCCVDFSRFQERGASDRKQKRLELGIENRNVFVYVGSLGTWYLASEMADLFNAAREADPKTFPLILTQSDPEIFKGLLLARGFRKSDFHITKVPHVEIPDYLHAADIAVSFIKPCYSKLSSSPTKIAEYLACGLPIVTNSGVGDVAEVISKYSVGTVVQSFDEESYSKALKEIGRLRADGNLRKSCVEAAKNEFDLKTVAGTKYRSIYSKLLN